MVKLGALYKDGLKPIKWDSRSGLYRYGESDKVMNVHTRPSSFRQWLGTKLNCGAVLLGSFFISLAWETRASFTCYKGDELMLREPSSEKNVRGTGLLS
jgi:hypothetical protein